MDSDTDRSELGSSDLDGQDESTSASPLQDARTSDNTLIRERSPDDLNDQDSVISDSHARSLASNKRMRKAPHRDTFECSVNDTSRVVFQNCTITTSNNTNCKIYFSKGKTENYVRVSGLVHYVGWSAVEFSANMCWIQVEREGREPQQATVGNGGSIFVHGHDL